MPLHYNMQIYYTTASLIIIPAFKCKFIHLILPIWSTNMFFFYHLLFSTANLLFNSLKPPPKSWLGWLWCVVCIVYIFIFHSTRAENPLSPISHYAKIFTQHPKAQSTHSINIYIFFFFSFSFLFHFFCCCCILLLLAQRLNEITTQINNLFGVYVYMYMLMWVCVYEFVSSYHPFEPPKALIMCHLYSRKLVPLVLWV